MLELDNRSEVVLVTVCTKDRKPILASSKALALIVDAWIAADRWLVGRFVLMPDHLHCFVTPRGPEAPPLGRWVRYWKSVVARRWENPEDRPIWQRDFWDRQLRSGESYGLKWDYVRNNPVRAGLVARPEDWPCQGELNQFLWHDR